MKAVPASHFELIAIFSSTSLTSEFSSRAPMLNCTSICGWSCQLKASGAFGFSTERSLMYCEMIPAENVGVKHAKWDKRDGYKVGRDCYNSYFYIVEDESLNIVDKFRLHGRKYIEHLTGGSALHMNLQEHLSREQYRHLLRVASQEGCNYFTFNIPNTVCNDCGHIDKRNLKACPKCNGRNLDYLTRIIGYMKRVSNFSQARQQEAARRHYATPGQL